MNMLLLSALVCLAIAIQNPNLITPNPKSVLDEIIKPSIFGTNGEVGNRNEI